MSSMGRASNIIALLTSNIVDAVLEMRRLGMQFLGSSRYVL